MGSPLQETRIGENVFVWTLGGEGIPTSYGANCVGVVGTDAVLIVDPLIAPAHARLVDDALKEKTDAPVRYVVLTHHHTDHVLGAAHFFESQDSVVICHRECREFMAAEHPDLIAERRRQPELRDLFADAEPVHPAIVFDENLVLYVGGVEVEVWHPGWGHTPGDAFLFIPDAGVAVCGDLIFAGYHYNYESASIPGLRKGLQSLGALDAETFIPGHGPVAGPDALDAQTRYHETVEAIISAGAAEGKSDDALVEEIRAAFPDHKLSLVIPGAVKRFKEHLAQTR